MKTERCLPAVWTAVLAAALPLAAAAGGDLLAYWDFGATAAKYTETCTVQRVTFAALALTANAGSFKDPNGKNGVAYTDPDGVTHAGGQAAALDEAIENAGTLDVRLDGRGRQLSEVRWDAFTDDAGDARGPKTYDLSYSVDGGVHWIPLARDAPFVRDGSKTNYYPYSYSLTNHAALRNAAEVRLLIHNLAGGTAGACGFDNVMVAGWPENPDDLLLFLPAILARPATNAAGTRAGHGRGL